AARPRLPRREIFVVEPSQRGTRNAERGMERGVSCPAIPQPALRAAQSNQVSGLVLRRPETRSPSFHWPRFLSSATRSKRLSTLRLAPVVPTARRLECCDIDSLNG